jgi:undecaprenyl-diphosphatase
MPPADGCGPKDAVPPAQAFALGLIHGPAELLPVSSSAHTALIPWLARWSYIRLDAAARKDFEVVLHAGTGLALALRLRRWRGPDRHKPGLLAAALAPPALAGLALERVVEQRLGGPRAIAAGLVAGALAMALADRTPAHPERPPRTTVDADWRDGLALGLAQAVALAPGVSRNGAALAAARARGFARADAQSLSWTVGLPVIVGPVLLRGRRLAGSPDAGMALGGGAAFASSWLTAGALRRERPLSRYAAYRCALAAIVLAVRRRRAQ